jgi:hypothetical protein
MAYYAWTATERAMNAQEVIVKTIEGQLNWNQAANAHLQQPFLPWHNRELIVPAGQAGSAFVPCPAPTSSGSSLCSMRALGQPTILGHSTASPATCSARRCA